uniref:(northern house mosquito) hypothetical protein n=1 Tax=Culex pipiens TaxID=7175 RepID=A0A8D8N1L0_CULPI
MPRFDCDGCFCCCWRGAWLQFRPNWCKSSSSSHRMIGSCRWGGRGFLLLGSIVEMWHRCSEHRREDLVEFRLLLLLIVGHNRRSQQRRWFDALLMMPLQLDIPQPTRN